MFQDVRIRGPSHYYSQAKHRLANNHHLFEQKNKWSNQRQSSRGSVVHQKQQASLIRQAEVLLPSSGLSEPTPQLTQCDQPCSASSPWCDQPCSAKKPIVRPACSANDLLICVQKVTRTLYKERIEAKQIFRGS